MMWRRYIYMNDNFFIVAGLGNYGSAYEQTRHNVGFRVIDRILAKNPVKKSREKFNGLLYECTMANRKIILVKPLTYMNLSGECIAAVMKWYKVTPGNLLVVYDDINLDEGRIRIRQNGSAGTHNGMKSVVQMLGSSDFPRIRVGVGKPTEGRDLIGHVLSVPAGEESAAITKGEDTAAAAIEDIIRHGMEYAMCTYNGVKS